MSRRTFTTTLQWALLLLVASRGSALLQPGWHSGSLRSNSKNPLRLPRRGRIPMELHYRDSDERQPAEETWWRSIFSPSLAEKVPERQEAVDDYLVFLDKRYRRMHEDEMTEETPSSWWNFLRDSSPNRNEVFTTKHHQENALYALGVAGLASERLRQKYHMQSQILGDESTPGLALEPIATSAPECHNDSASSASPRSLIESKVAFAVRHAMAWRRSMLRSQMKKVRMMLWASLKALASTPKIVIEKLWKLGGGQSTVLFTVSAMSAAFVLIRSATASNISLSMNA